MRAHKQCPNTARASSFISSKAVRGPSEKPGEGSISPTTIISSVFGGFVVRFFHPPTDEEVVVGPQALLVLGLPPR